MVPPETPHAKPSTRPPKSKRKPKVHRTGDGLLLERWMLHKGLNQADLARARGVSAQAVQNALDKSSLGVAAKNGWAKALGISDDVLLEGRWPDEVEPNQEMVAKQDTGDPAWDMLIDAARHADKHGITAAILRIIHRMSPQERRNLLNAIRMSRNITPQENP